MRTLAILLVIAGVAVGFGSRVAYTAEATTQKAPACCGDKCKDMKCCCKDNCCDTDAKKAACCTTENCCPKSCCEKPAK